MKNLLFVILLTVSSAVYSQINQDIFKMSGTALFGEAPITFINVYESSRTGDNWIYYSGNDVYSQYDSKYNIVLPIENQVYLVEFVNGNKIKQVYMTTPKEGSIHMDVNFTNNNVGVVFYDRELSNYNFDIGTLEELFDSSED